MALPSHADAEPVTEGETSARSKAAGGNAEPLASASTGSLTCNGGAGGPAPAEEEREGAKKGDSEESGDVMGPGLLTKLLL